MGVQIPAYSICVDNLSREWSVYRKSLRKEDQVFFDEFFRITSLNIQAGNAMANPFPMETALLTAVIHLLKSNYNLKEELRQLREQHNRMAD